MCYMIRFFFIFFIVIYLRCMQPPFPPSENLFPITSHPEKELVVDLLNTMLW